MDVTCDRCKAEYEFDEALLGERGTTVKCSACGHVFRVLPPSRGASRSQLQLRYAQDGSVRALASLRDLQQRIRAGEVSLDDELGRDGFPFRALRDIPELKNFFLSQPGRHDRSTVRPDGTYPRREPGTTRMPIHPESISPGPDAGGAETGDSDPPDVSTLPPPLPGTREREAADARRRAASARTEQAVADQRAANRTMQAAAGIPPEVRARNFRQGTMMGVGPEDPQLPPPPRVPEFASKPKAPATPTGQATAPRSSPSGTGTVAGLSGLKPHQTLYGTPSGLPNTDTGQSVPSGSTHPMAHRTSDRPPPGLGGARSPSGERQAPAAAAEPPRRVGDVELPMPPADPEPLPQFKAAPSATPARNLYLDGEERPPPRAMESSRTWLYAGLLLVAAAGGGWFGMTRLRVSGKSASGQAGQPAINAASFAVGDAAVAAAEPGPSDAPTEGAEPDGASPTNAAPFAPPVPGIQEEIARRTAEQPAAAEPPEAQPEADKPEADKPEATRPEVAKAEPTKSDEPTKERPAKDKASDEKPAKNDRLARAERAAAANPQDYGAQLNRADALYAKGDNAAALEGYRQALALRPTGSEANSGMGFALLKDGKASDSLPYFDRAANSGYAEASIGLGDAYRALGQPSSAKEAYQAYLDRLPTGARAEYARTWLDKLSGGAKAQERSERNEEPAAYRPAGELTEPPQ